MRVIAGEFKGRRLHSPEGKEIRPTPDMVREALFSAIGPGIEDSVCLDMFAGSGALGIEAVSRGAAQCYFIESSRKNIELLRSNLVAIGEKNSHLIPGDFRNGIRHLAVEDIKIDYAFVDPPFNSDYYSTVMKLLADYGIIVPGGIVITEGDKSVHRDRGYDGFSPIMEKTYGRIVLVFWKKD